MSATEFSLFVFVILAAYYLLPRRWQSAVLLVANIFYCLSEGIICFISVLSVSFSAYLSSISIEKRKSRRALIGGIFLTLSSLVSYKITSAVGGGEAVAWGPGLGFYSLSAVGYLIDLYKGKIEREKSFVRLFSFLSFFPCLRLGPISRYDRLAPQLKDSHAPSWDNIMSGFIRVLWGYFKKLVIADRAIIALGVLVASPQKYGGGYAFFLIILYSVIIYADFTGGIDIALGVGKMLDITLAENFDRPFSSSSVREYWRRWHITLGAFFSDYVFYPLSVSRPMQRLSKRIRHSGRKKLGKRLPIYLALIFTWILTGAWHGLSANFLTWGLANAAVIIAAQELSPLFKRTRPNCTRLRRARTNCPRRFLTAARTFFIIGAIRLFDLWRDPVTVLRAVASVFTDVNGWVCLLSGGIYSLGLSAPDWMVIICGVALIFVVSRADLTHSGRAREIISRRPLAATACAALLILITAIFGVYGVEFDSSSFIYSQF